ncbi:enoyl-CoA hydratase [Clostridiaceae bacterium]|jgi:3-hydroxybutyryl-CoA dehydratase|nr:MaoC family dehydratase [Clostridium sp.]NBI71388.1 enoyl-CoA hydratase [Clostridiaceae bacterium]
MKKRLEAGQVCTFQKKVSDEDVRKFAEVTGDKNPLHLDDGFASTTMFKERIAHGMIGAGIISGGLAMHMPGLGTTYLEQDLKFMRPVRIGDVLTVELKVLEILPKTKFDIAKIRTTCMNEQGEIVISGTATVIPPGM